MKIFICFLLLNVLFLLKPKAQEKKNQKEIRRIRAPPLNVASDVFTPQTFGKV